MSQTILLALQDLSCGHCVNRVKQALEARDDVELIKISQQYAFIRSDAEPNSLIQTVVEAGYQATEAQQPDAVLTLSGLSCMRCAAACQTALEAVEGVFTAQVDTQQAQIFGQAASESLLAAVEQAGYHAAVTETRAFPKPEPLTMPTDPVSLSAERLSPSTQTEDTFQLLLEGMSCASCVAKVEQALRSVPGVAQARVNLAERSALVKGSPQPEALLAAVQQAGYGAEIVQDESVRREKQYLSAQRSMRRFLWQSALALALGLPLMIWGLLSDSMILTEQNQTVWQGLGILTGIIMLISGGHFFRNAWRSLLNRSATMDTLVALGTGAAWLYSMALALWPEAFPPQARHIYFEASVMIIGLINLGHALEQRARQRSSKALEKLLDLTPPTARLVTQEGEQEIPVAEISVGMTLRLTTGDRVPVDGIVQQGEGWLDEAMLTGEPLPQQKEVGAILHAGTQMQDGTLLFTASAVGSHTTLARIIHLVRQAQSSKPAIGRLADQISAVFVPVVVGIALFSGALWALLGPAPQLMYTLVVVTTVLIIACPCALGLATPMSIISGVGRAAELGILVRDADALQQASQVDTVVFDKTGTLTEGKPKVVALHTLPPFEEETVLRFAAALEQGASHPLALAILERAEGLSMPSVEQFRTLKGLGVRGHIEGQTVLLGNQALLEQQGIDCRPFQLWLEEHAREGATPVLLAINQQPAALFALRDTLRPDSQSALQRLHRQGYRLVMLTGDNPLTAQSIAQEVGIDEVIAGVLPEGKAAAIQTLQAAGHKVAMVGDGINDAPALAQAEVGIALGSGSDIAIETAALTLMRHSLMSVADALALSQTTLRNMKQNLLGAFIYNALGIPIAAGILYPFTGSLLSPVIAGGAMALSSITVVSNANRLLRFKPRQ